MFFNKVRKFILQRRQSREAKNGQNNSQSNDMSPNSDLDVTLTGGSSAPTPVLSPGDEAFLDRDGGLSPLLVPNDDDLLSPVSCHFVL